MGKKGGGKILSLMAVLLLSVYFLYAWMGTPPGRADSVLREIEEKKERAGSYYALQEIEYIGKPGNRKYVVEQWFRAPGDYRMEINMESVTGQMDGRQVIVKTGGEVYINNPELDGFYRFYPMGKPELPGFLLEDYWKTVVNAPEAELKYKEKRKGREYYVWEIRPGEPDRERVKEKIWLEKDSLVPYRVEVYDGREVLTRLITFKETRLGMELPDSLFVPG